MGCVLLLFWFLCLVTLPEVVCSATPSSSSIRNNHGGDLGDTLPLGSRRSVYHLCLTSNPFSLLLFRKKKKHRPMTHVRVVHTYFFYVQYIITTQSGILHNRVVLLVMGGLLLLYILYIYIYICILLKLFYIEKE